MGMFDYVSISPAALKHYDVKCKDCDFVPAANEWQTKDFENMMDHYYLDFDSKGDVRLFKLDPPSKEYWVEYTEEEVLEKNKTNLLWPTTFKTKKGDGYYKEEGFLPENRRKRYMGELPHQISLVYMVCKECENKGQKYPKGWIELEIKFTDGVAVKISQVEKKEGYDESC